MRWYFSRERIQLDITRNMVKLQYVGLKVILWWRYLLKSTRSMINDDNLYNL